MITANELVGVWVDENFGGLGPEVLILFPNERGATDYYNPTFAGRDEFRWELIGRGTQLRFSQYSASATPTKSYEVSFHSRESQRILRLEFDSPGDEALGISGGHFTCDYRLSSVSVNDYLPPDEEPA